MIEITSTEFYRAPGAWLRWAWLGETVVVLDRFGKPITQLDPGLMLVRAR